MKKALCLFFCLVLFVPSALADTSARKLTTDDPLYTSLYERSMELAGLFNEALHNEQYISLMAFPSSAQEELALLQTQDFTQPWSVTIVRSDSVIPIYLSYDPQQMLDFLLDWADVSPALKTLEKQKLYGSLGTLLLDPSGTSTVALSSALSITDAFIQPEEMDGPCVALMFYGGLYVYLVTFCPTANGAVLVRAQFIPSSAADELNLPLE